MRKLALGIAGAAALIGVSGCVAEGHGTYYSGGATIGYDGYGGYYDDYYGPVYDGYWGPDNYFYYSAGAGRPFLRDEGHHFRHDAHEGFHEFHGHGAHQEHH